MRVFLLVLFVGDVINFALFSCFLLVRLKAENNGCESCEFWSWYLFGEHVGWHVSCAKVLELYDAFFDVVNHEGELVHKVFGAFVVATVVGRYGDIG